MMVMEGILYLLLVWIWQWKAKIMTMHSLTNLLLLHQQRLALWRIRRKNAMRFARPSIPYWLLPQSIFCLRLPACVPLALHVWKHEYDGRIEKDGNEWIVIILIILFTHYSYLEIMNRIWTGITSNSNSTWARAPFDWRFVCYRHTNQWTVRIHLLFNLLLNLLNLLL